MRLCFYIYFLTLVLVLSATTLVPSSVKAANASGTHTVPPPITSKKQKSNETKTIPSVQLETLSNPPLEPATEEPRPSYLLPTRYMVDHSNTFNFAFRTGAVLPQKLNTSLVGFTFVRNQYNSNLTAQSFGFSFFTTGNYGPHWDFQWNRNPGVGYEFFWKMGVGSLFDPDESLSSWIRMERYHFRLAAGWEDVLKKKRRLRFDGVFNFSPYGTSFGVNLGWALSDEQVSFRLF